MREILFRGKRVDNGEFIEGDLLLNSSNDGCGGGVVILNNNLYYQVILETVGQFTGLKDVYDVKLFEGDIVNGCCFNGSYAFGVISFYESSFIVLPIGKFIEGISDIRSNIIERIGNIHDNPELAPS